MLSLSCDVAVPDVSPHGHPLGIDVGLDAFVATSDGELIDRPRFFVDAQHKTRVLREAQLHRKLAPEIAEPRRC